MTLIHWKRTAATVRDRDTMAQERVKIEDLVKYIEDRLEF